MLAHDINKIPRTIDIETVECNSFNDVNVTQLMTNRLKELGFLKPSPIQLKSIPLGRCGSDLIIQAKSGTGKTLVYSILVLENINWNSNELQALIVVPTREIAIQSCHVIRSLGEYRINTTCHYFIGGTSLEQDEKNLRCCQIAVGTPGRLKHLIEKRILNTNIIKMFILDEADKLMESSFQETIKWIFNSLPLQKQVLALSATYPELMITDVSKFMITPISIRLNSTNPTLLGIRQYYEAIPHCNLEQKSFDTKVCKLITILENISFQQCLIFSNFHARAEALTRYLNNKDWPAVQISGAQKQEFRTDAISKLKLFECRILVTTDLTSRGIDAQNVNLVVNLDMPHDYETYLHRIGRAGRYGSYGAAITLLTEGKEITNLQDFLKNCNSEIKPLPNPLPENLADLSENKNNGNDYVTSEILKIQEKKSENFNMNLEDNNTRKINTIQNIPTQLEVSQITKELNKLTIKNEKSNSSNNNEKNIQICKKNTQKMKDYITKKTNNWKLFTNWVDDKYTFHLNQYNNWNYYF